MTGVLIVAGIFAYLALLSAVLGLLKVGADADSSDTLELGVDPKTDSIELRLRH